MKMSGWYKVKRSEKTKELMRDPKAWVLACQIAYRAKWSDCFSVHGLEPNQALIGDHKSCGLSAREYRTAKHKLKKYGISTFNPTSKGTVATLIDTDVFGVYDERPDKQGDTPETSQRQAGDKPETTNKKGKKGNNGRKEEYTPDFLAFWAAYPRKVGKKGAYKAWKAAKDKPPIEKLIEIIEQQKAGEQWTKEGGQYIPHPSTWLNQGCWDDEAVEIIEPEIAHSRFE